MDSQSVEISDPFNPDGREASWVVVDMNDHTEISPEMNHYDAMRVNVDHRYDAVVRADRLKTDMVFATLVDSRFLTGPSSVDVSSLFERMEMDDFVRLQGHAYQGEEISAYILKGLVAEQHPRAGRLDHYLRDLATPDVDDAMPVAVVKIREEDVMGWLERNRRDIHEELAYRVELQKPSYSF